MLKKVNWYQILTLFIWVISLSGLVALMGFIEGKKLETKCRNVEIYLPGNQFFVERKEVNELLNKQNDSLVGKKLASLNIQKIENTLKNNPFILSAKVYADMDGIIHADVKQRIPLLRMINGIGQDFYVDKLGYKIPLSTHYTARVLVANGAINESFNNKIDTLKSKVAKDIYQIASFIGQSSVWNEQIEQIYVNNNNVIELVPRVGDQKIILGNGEFLKEKFRNLMVLYKKGFSKFGWQTYKTINLSYRGQIVCEKRDSTSLNLSINKSDSIKLKQQNNTVIKDSIKKIL